MDPSFDSLEESRQIEDATPDPEQNEAASGSCYIVIPLLPTDPRQVALRNGKIPWLHVRAKWSWALFTYSSHCHAWVTDAKNGGNLVKVDRLEAHLVHDSCYGRHSKDGANVSSTGVGFKFSGLFACKTGVTAWACAKQSGWGRWCTKKIDA